MTGTDDARIDRGRGHSLCCIPRLQSREATRFRSRLRCQPLVFALLGADLASMMLPVHLHEPPLHPPRPRTLPHLASPGIQPLRPPRLCIPSRRQQHASHHRMRSVGELQCCRQLPIRCMSARRAAPALVLSSARLQLSLRLPPRQPLLLPLPASSSPSRSLLPPSSSLPLRAQLPLLHPRL